MKKGKEKKVNMHAKSVHGPANFDTMLRERLWMGKIEGSKEDFCCKDCSCCDFHDALSGSAFSIGHYEDFTSDSDSD